MDSCSNKYRRIVIKIGSSLFYEDKKRLSVGLLEDLASQISGLVKEKTEVVVVSSGAIALGMSQLELAARPKELSVLQAAAAIGQNRLMSLYAQAFQMRGLVCGQVLLTWDDFTSRKRYLNAKNTLDQLLKLGAVPVINENDTVSTDEIKFGDNDQLSSLVATLVSADLLVILSDVDGLLDRDKKTVIRKVFAITGDITSLASSTDKKTSVGGMITKIKAAKMAVDSGIPVVIAGGRQPDVIAGLALDITRTGTLFVPKKSGLNQRQRWIAFGAKPKGQICADDGAKKALQAGKSLLSVGITKCCGSFGEGDIVCVADRAGIDFARGRVSVSAKVVEKVLGSRFDKEIIHRDNIVILE